jgi:site-specific recombinase XerD
MPAVLAALQQAPTDAKPSDTSTVDLLVRFEDEALTHQSAYTVRAHQSAVLRLARWLQPRTLVQATAADLSDWLDTLTLYGKDLDERQTVIYRFYDWLCAKGLIANNPSVRPFHLAGPVVPDELAQWLDGWRLERERREVSTHTISRETNLLVDFYSFVAPKSMMEVGAEDIYSWLDSHGRRSTPLAANTRKGYVSSLSAFYRWAMRAGLVAFDPTEDVLLPRRATAVPRPINDRDLALALKLADPTMRAILSLVVRR